MAPDRNLVLIWNSLDRQMMPNYEKLDEIAAQIHEHSELFFTRLQQHSAAKLEIRNHSELCIA